MQNGRSCRSEQKSRVSLCVFIENSGRRKERGRRDTAAHRQLFLLLFFGRPISRPGHVAAKTRGGWISTFASSSSSSYMIRVPPLWWWCVHGPCCFRAQSTPIGRRQKKRTAMKTNHALSHRSRVSRPTFLARWKIPIRHVNTAAAFPPNGPPFDLRMLNCGRKSLDNFSFIYSVVRVIIPSINQWNGIIFFCVIDRSWRLWAHFSPTSCRPAGRFRPSFWVPPFSPDCCSWPSSFSSTRSSTDGWPILWSLAAATNDIVISTTTSTSSVRPWRPNRLPWNRIWLPWKSVNITRRLFFFLRISHMVCGDEEVITLGGTKFKWLT